MLLHTDTHVTSRWFLLYFWNGEVTAFNEDEIQALTDFVNGLFEHRPEGAKYHTYEYIEGEDPNLDRCEVLHQHSECLTLKVNWY